MSSNANSTHETLSLKILGPNVKVLNVAKNEYDELCGLQSKYHNDKAALFPNASDLEFSTKVLSEKINEGS